MKILVTGGRGFLGKHLCSVLKDYGPLDGSGRLTYTVVPVGRAEANLDSYSMALRLFQQQKPDVVYHLAASVGGIGANQRNPAVFWRDNLLMGVHVLDAALATNVKKLIMVGTTCSYPKSPKTIPFVEEELFQGYPEPTNAPYGIAKLALLTGAQAYKKQFGLDVVTAIPTNLYGPGDNLDPEASHVIPALMRKFMHAAAHKAKTVELWGTGKATRDFLFVRDAAKGLARMINYDRAEPVNLGSGIEVSIKQLATKIAAITHFNGTIIYDHSKPDGQPRRCLDTTYALSRLDWRASTSLDDGLDQTYEWMRAL